MIKLHDFFRQIRSSTGRRVNDSRIRHLAGKIAKSQPESKHAPVIFFNASTRLSGLSLNAGFSLISAWGFRLQGVPVMHFVCKAGMSRCVLGTNRDDVSQKPPCDKCIAHSQAEYSGADVHWFEYTPDQELAGMLEGLGIESLEKIEYGRLPLGKLVMPALRWELRRHHLSDDDPTRTLFREFILSAWNVAVNFTHLLEKVKPTAIVVFNGQFFPEAVVRMIARQKGIRTVAHEVGMLPFTAFFTDGEATAYPIEIPEAVSLTAEQNSRLDDYLAKRFQGQFKMAGIQFWQGMQPLDSALLEKMSRFRQTVPVFTNVIFDTSQPHSNVVFEDMFAWLDQVVELAKKHPDTLFVIRAHPDELRPGTAKQSRETVREWVNHSGALQHPNIHYIDALEYVSSYELIRKSKFTMVYNSSIGLEAAIMGLPVLSAGQSRYTRYPTVFFPATIRDYVNKADQMLNSEIIEVPPDFLPNARKFLYYQLFKTALPFNEFLEESLRPGLVIMKKFQPGLLNPERSPAMKVIQNGILNGKSFLLEDE